MGADKFAELRRAISERRAIVGVVGQGYVGYGLAQRAAEAGFAAYGYDIAPEVVARCAQSPLEGYRATNDPGVLAQCDVILLAVPTPTREDDDGRRSDLSIVMEATETVAEQIAGSEGRPRLFVSESTYGPGTTRRLIAPMLRRVDRDERIAIGYSPERIDPGNVQFELADIPKVTSGIDEASAAVTALFYEQLVVSVVPASSMEAAEATKLLENTFRFVNIALAHEFDEYCEALGLSSHEVTRLAATKPFGFMPFYAGAGVGGHCIAEDPYFLYDSMQAVGTSTDLLATSIHNHDARAEVVVHRILRRLGGHSPEGAHILVLGAAYKPNIGDTRRSPALPVIHGLEARDAVVDYHDPHVPAFAGRTSVDLEAADPSDYDLAVVLVEHDAFDVEALERQGWAVYRLTGDHAASFRAGALS